MKICKVWIIGLLCYCSILTFAIAQDWPLHNARWTISLQKDINTNPPPHEPSDIRWLHLHRAHPTLADASENTIAPVIFRGLEELDPSASGIQLRYTVHGVAVSDWIDPPFRFTLNIDNPALAQLPDGVHDLSVDVRGATRADFKPWRAFVHLSRDKSAGEPFGFDKQVPIINNMQGNPTDDAHFGPGVVYVNPDERDDIGYPVDPTVTAWQAPPTDAPLYQELMAPHTELFNAVQMWWDHPAHPDSPFVRGLTPQHGEDHRNLRVTHQHEKFPMKDGPRGIGWMSPYVGGQIDSQGRLAFAEVGGRVGYLMPDGEIITIAGWRVAPGKDPIWWSKPVDEVRRNMQLRGNWQEGRGEFLTPLDVAIDPLDESIWYVVGYEDNVVWKVELPDDIRTQEATVSVFAGDPDHASGNVDGVGQTARFNGPASIVFDPVNDVLYVADQDNDSIRQVTRDGTVSTLFGESGMRQRLTAQGVDWTDQLAARGVSRVEVSESQATQGVKPDIFLPQVLRVDSQGNIILLELGYGAVRRINPDTGVTDILGEVQQKHHEFDRGWAWLDVDRYGNSGPKDGIYWVKFVSTLPGERFNEVIGWFPPDGGESIALFPPPTGLYPDGWGRNSQTNPPHYPWLVAVDPRGAVLLAGGGEHGVTRLRVQKEDDPIEAQDYWLGRSVWNSGSDADASYAANSFSLKYGQGGHNHLGLTNAWALGDADDQQLLDAFEVSGTLRNDDVARQQWFDFIRPNTHSGSDSVNPDTPVIPITPVTPEPPVTSPLQIPAFELPDRSWRQISLPCDAGNASSIEQIFSDDGLGNYGSDWLVLAHDPIGNAYTELSEQSVLEQGTGYWINQRSGATRQIDMPASCSATPRQTACSGSADCYAVPLNNDSQSSRYQMIGYPFSQPGAVDDTFIKTSSGDCADGCAFGSAAANQYVQPWFLSYNGAEFVRAESGDNLSAWSGYWVLLQPAAAGSNIQLLFGQVP